MINDIFLYISLSLGRCIASLPEYQYLLPVPVLVSHKFWYLFLLNCADSTVPVLIHFMVLLTFPKGLIQLFTPGLTVLTAVGRAGGNNQEVQQVRDNNLKGGRISILMVIIRIQSSPNFQYQTRRTGTDYRIVLFKKRQWLTGTGTCTYPSNSVSVHISMLNTGTGKKNLLTKEIPVPVDQMPTRIEIRAKFFDTGISLPKEDYKYF